METLEMAFPRASANRLFLGMRLGLQVAEEKLLLSLPVPDLRALAQARSMADLVEKLVDVVAEVVDNREIHFLEYRDLVPAQV